LFSDPSPNDDIELFTLFHTKKLQMCFQVASHNCLIDQKVNPQSTYLLPSNF